MNMRFFDAMSLDVSVTNNERPNQKMKSSLFRRIMLSIKEIITYKNNFDVYRKIQLELFGLANR